MADDFLMCGVKKMGGFPKTNESPNESTPASVPNEKRAKLSGAFTQANSDGPWVEDAKKDGTGGRMEKKKIWGMADDHTLTNTSHK